jgi:hypothetical protein
MFLPSESRRKAGFFASIGKGLGWVRQGIGMGSARDWDGFGKGLGWVDSKGKLLL